jgi:class 3 adenylate cyclase
MHSSDLQRRQVVLVMTDLVGSVEWQARLGMADYIAQIKKPHDQLIRRLVESQTGAEILEHTGDGYVISCPGATEAVALCLLVQQELQRLSAAGAPIQVRIGIHQGEVADNGPGVGPEPRIVGMPINVVARVMGLAMPGQILVTRSIYDDAYQFLRKYPATEDTRDVPELRWLSHGIFRLKGQDQGVDVFEPGGLGIAPLKRPPDSEKATHVASDVAAGADHRPQTATSPSSSPLPLQGKRFVLLYRRRAEPDETLLKKLEVGLRELGANVFIDRHMTIGDEWGKEIRRSLVNADAILPLISAAAIHSEMLEWELGVAKEEFEKRPDSLHLLPVRVQFEENLPTPVGKFLDRYQYSVWRSPADTQPLLEQLASVFKAPPRFEQFPPTGGAMLPDNKLYVVRPTDHEFVRALERRDPIVLVKGARQMGKSSLLAQGCKWARDNSRPHVVIDCQDLSASDLASPSALYRAFATVLAQELELAWQPGDGWNDQPSPGVSFKQFLRDRVLSGPQGVIWILDEVDRLFDCTFRSEVFGLFRSFYSARSFKPTGPLSKFSLVISYATEAQFFITDTTQSPFNVGTKVQLRDFSLRETEQLNERYNGPLQNAGQLNEFYGLLGGQPYLTNRGLLELTQQGATLQSFLDRATSTEGPFGDHLRRIVVLLSQETALREVVKGHLQGRPCASLEAFYRLRSAGIVAGEAPKSMQPRCRLYQLFLEEQLQ